MPAAESAYALDARTKTIAMAMDQSTGQTIGECRAFVGSIPTRGGVYACEVFDNEDAETGGWFADYPGIALSAAAVPNLDAPGASPPDGRGTAIGYWRENGGTITTIVTAFDEAYPAVTSDYIYNTGHKNSEAYYHNYGTAALAATLAGKRILGIRLYYNARRSGSAGSTTLKTKFNFNGGNEYEWSSQALSTTSTYYLTPISYYNPDTRLPWTLADIATFDTTLWVGFYSQASAGGINTVVSYAGLYVYYCDENRIAVGGLDDSSSLLTEYAWNAMAMLTPAGAAWTKDGAGKHLYTLRRITDVGSLTLPTLSEPDAESAGLTTLTNVRTYFPTTETTYGTVGQYGVATPMGDSTPGGFGLIQRTTAPAESVDSQPYADVIEAKVFTGQDAEQEISNHAAAIYGNVTALIKPNDATASLVVNLKRRSDNVSFGTGTVTIATAAALPDYNDWKVLRVSLGSLTILVAGTQYYIEFQSSSAGTGTDYWSIMALDTVNQGNGATYQGATDRAVVNTVEADQYDLSVTIGSIPTTPGGFGVSVLSQAV